MTEQTYPPVAPHWPLGRIAQFYVRKPKGGLDIGVRELVISSVTPTEDGWLVKAELPARFFAADNRTFEFEVDEDGESSDCVPWDEDLDREHNPVRGRGSFTEKPGERPTRYGEPGMPTDPYVVYDPETGETKLGPDETEGWTDGEGTPVRLAEPLRGEDGEIVYPIYTPAEPASTPGSQAKDDASEPLWAEFEAAAHKGAGHDGH